MGLLKGITNAFLEIVDGVVKILTGIIFALLYISFLAVSIALTPLKAIYNLIRNAFLFKKFKKFKKEKKRTRNIWLYDEK